MGLRQLNETTGAWTEITRAQYRRDDLAYASNMRDTERALIEPLMPWANRLHRPRRTDLRRVVEAILFIVTTDSQWRQLPRHFPPFTTVQDYFYGWIRDGRRRSINDLLVMVSREQNGREPSPSAGILDSQSVNTAKNGGPRGFDASEFGSDTAELMC